MRHHENLSDDALIALAKKSDTPALTALIERHWRTALASAYAASGNAQDAHDAAQDAMMKIVGELSNVWRGGSFRAWVAYTARRKALENLKDNMRRKVRENKAVAMRDLSFNAADAGEKAETLAILRQELNKLSAGTAEVLTLFHVHALPINEIAKSTGLSVDACKQRLVRGREDLGTRLKRRGIVLSALMLMGLLAEDAHAFSAGCSAAQIADAAQSIARTLPPAPAASKFTAKTATAITAACVLAVTLAFVPFKKGVVIDSSAQRTASNAQPVPVPPEKSSPTNKESEMKRSMSAVNGAIAAGLIALNSLAVRAEETPAPVADAEKKPVAVIRGTTIDVDTAALDKAIAAMPKAVADALPGKTAEEKRQTIVTNLSLADMLKQISKELPADMAVAAQKAADAAEAGQQADGKSDGNFFTFSYRKENADGDSGDSDAQATFEAGVKVELAFDPMIEFKTVMPEGMVIEALDGITEPLQIKKDVFFFKIGGDTKPAEAVKPPAPPEENGEF